MTLPRLVNTVLLAAIGIDVALSAMTFIAPEVWFQTLHGTAPDALDLAFLRRCGANWAAFAIVQAIALWRWRSGRHWLAVVAGVRFSDVLTDVTYLANSDVLPLGVPGLILPLFLNAGMGALMLAVYHRSAAR